MISEIPSGASARAKFSQKFGRLAALAAVTGLCFGPSIQNSSAIILPNGGYAPLQKGLYNIVNLQNGKAIDNNSSTQTGSVVVLKTRSFSNGQNWAFTQNSDNSWTIVNSAGGQALDDGNTNANNAKMIQYTANSANNNQRWFVDLLSDGNYRFTNKASGKVLDSGSKFNDGTPVVQYTSNNGSQQHWKIYLPAI